MKEERGPPRDFLEESLCGVETGEGPLSLLGCACPIMPCWRAGGASAGDPQSTEPTAVAGDRAVGGQRQPLGGAEELKGGYRQCDCLEGTQNFCHAEGTRSFPVTLCFFLPLSQVGACSPSPGQCHRPGPALGGWQHPAAGSRLLFTERTLQLISGHAR